MPAKPNSPSLDTTLPLTEISFPTNNLFEISTLLTNDTSVNIFRLDVLEPILFTDISLNLASVELVIPIFAPSIFPESIFAFVIILSSQSIFPVNLDIVISPIVPPLTLSPDIASPSNII